MRVIYLSQRDIAHMPIRKKTYKKSMYTMGTKKTYAAPAILRLVDFAPHEALLVGSIVDKATVTSQGQQVETYEWNTEGFNHDWED